MASRYRSPFSWVKRCGAARAGALIATLTTSGCGPASASSSASACVPDPERAGRLVALLAGRAESRDLLDERAASAVCFADGPGTLHPGGVLVLPRGVGDAEGAARLAHLLHHQRHGRGLVALEPVDGSDCDRAVEEALREEAAAHVLEMELRDALGVEAPIHPLGLQTEVLRLARGERSEAVLAFLRAHPEGGEGYPPLGRDYRERCERD